MNLVGRVLKDRYTVRALLAEGGQATVALADDAVTGDRVVVKLYQSASERGPRESVLLASLQHPNIIRRLDRGAWEGRRYVVLPHYPDSTLAARIIAQGPLAPDRVLQGLVGLLDALSVVHPAGIVHRDIKPSNILLDGDQWILGDFGIASVPWSDLTAEGVTLGSVEFMAPEQRAGSSGVGPAADVYSVATTVFHALTAQSASHLYLSERERGRLSQFNAGLATLLWRATRHEPQNRYGDADEMRGAVESLMQRGFTPTPSLTSKRKKLCLIGPAGAGKSSLVARLIEGGFEEDYRTTFASRLHRWEDELDGLGTQCVIWDLEGFDGVSAGHSAMLRGAHGLIIVLDATRPETLGPIRKTVAELEPVLESAVVGLAVNKWDLDHRWNDDHADYRHLLSISDVAFTTSARESTRVHALFNGVLRQMRRRSAAR